MTNQIKNPIIIPKEAIAKEGIVILPLREYQKTKEEIEKLKKQKGISLKELEILKIIAEGEKEYREKKLKPLKSLAELK
jgi:hypothetical protein